MFNPDDYRFHKILDALEKTHGRPGSGTAWLDLGCHNGSFLNRVVDRYGIHSAGMDVYDPSLKGKEPWVYFRRDLDKSFDLDEKFDFVSALEVLEHMVDTDAFLRHCRELMRSEGILLITTPNINCLRNRVMTFFGAYPTGLEYKNVIHHVRLYNIPVLKKHLAEHGFEVTYVAGVSFLPILTNRNTPLRKISERLAKTFPQMCNNVIVLARKK